MGEPRAKKARAENTPAPDSRITWSQKFTDFAVVLKSGDELRCHKHVLSDNSPFLDDLLSGETAEARANKLDVSGLEEETVVSFLQYVYTPCPQERPRGSSYKRVFEEKRLTMELLEMAHRYGVQDLQDDCTKHLIKNINENNVMAMWMKGESMENDGLRDGAMSHLIASKVKPIEKVPGFTDTFGPLPKPVLDLLNRYDLAYRQSRRSYY